MSGLQHASIVTDPSDLDALEGWSRELGFSSLGVLSLSQEWSASEAVSRMRDWLAQGLHGEMSYLARHMPLRAQHDALLPGARSAVMVTMDYLPEAEGWQAKEEAAVSDPNRAVVSVYARGRDYHKVLRHRLSALARKMQEAWGPLGHRACVDSAPIMEVEWARQAGLGWRGKHTLLLSRARGSMFFLGTLLTDRPLPASAPVSDHCGSCMACLAACPTQAFLGPYQLDARRCISYLTIEHAGTIPEALRPLMGNRVYGCDDCQRVCPWNRHAQTASLPDFDVRHGLDAADLVSLFAWDEATFTARHAGSAIARIGHVRWLRNLAVGLGNALRAAASAGRLADCETIRVALQARSAHASDLVREHVAWALAQAPDR